MVNSKWFDKKSAALTLRQKGVSIRAIEQSLGIPRSTLSGWFKSIELKPSQKRKLSDNQLESLKRARLVAAARHRQQKEERLRDAEKAARGEVDKISLTPEVLDLSLAMLYLGEGAKSGSTCLANSNPKVLRFFMYVLRKNYGIKPEMFRCDLHLRMDQDSDELKNFWSEELGIPVERFKYVSKDVRSEGKPTYDYYKGVCVLQCGRIDIHRKLVYLYSLYIDRLVSIGV